MEGNNNQYPKNDEAPGVSIHAINGKQGVHTPKVEELIRRRNCKC